MHSILPILRKWRLDDEHGGCMRCGECKFFRETPTQLLDDRLVDSGIGECRRRAPVWTEQIEMPVDRNGSAKDGTVSVLGMATWPKVHPLLGGCGEFNEGGGLQYWFFQES